MIAHPDEPKPETTVWNCVEHKRSSPDPKLLALTTAGPSDDDHHRLVTFSDEGPDSRFPSSPVTDTGAAHDCRARRVHRAPHPRASTTSLNPAERSAAEIRRESHRPRAACRGVRATFGFDIQRKGCATLARSAGPPKRAGDVSKPNANRVRALFLARHRRHASRGRAPPRPQVRTAPTTPRCSLLPPASRRRFRPPNQILLEAC